MSAIDMDAAVEIFITAGAGEVTLLPDPPCPPVWHPVISVDDHALEPAHIFEARVPASMRADAPRIVDDEHGVPFWVLEGTRVPITVTNGAVGRPKREWNGGSQRFEHFRPGVSDPVARLADMDVCGIWASLCFPSVVFGFCGSRLARMQDQQLGLACVRAYNDWMLEEWCGAAPDRYIPCALPWMADPSAAAGEVRRNAEQGFRSVTFSENPDIRGFPSIHSGAWDPFFAACEETGTVVNLHVGSSGFVESPSLETSNEARAALFPVSAIKAAVDWIFSGVPLRFPDLRIALSEGGVSWVPMVIERLERAHRQVEVSKVWKASDPSPVEVLRRNFWFTSIEDPSAFRCLDLIGEDKVMVECDYPHQDSTWPDLQVILERDLGGLPSGTIDRICVQNAVDLYRWVRPSRSWHDTISGNAAPVGE